MDDNSRRVMLASGIGAGLSTGILILLPVDLAIGLLLALPVGAVLAVLTYYLLKQFPSSS